MSGTSQMAAAKAAGIDARTLRRHIQLQGLAPPAVASTTADKWAGRVFDLWTVLPNSYQYDSAKPSSRSVECRCECGTVRRVQITNLTNGVSRGCGCRNSTGQRVRTPWICAATGERVTTTAGLARHLGVNNLTLVRRLNKGRTYTDAKGQVWEPDTQAATPHIAKQWTWVCVETGQTWPSRSALEKHLGLYHHGLARAGSSYTAADGLTYSRTEAGA